MQTVKSYPLPLIDRCAIEIRGEVIGVNVHVNRGKLLVLEDSDATPEVRHFEVTPEGNEVVGEYIGTIPVMNNLRHVFDITDIVKEVEEKSKKSKKEKDEK